MTLFDTIAEAALALAVTVGLASPPQQAVVRRVLIEQGFVMRVPVAPMPHRAPFRWVEKKGPKCLDGELVRGASLSGPTSIDFVMVDRTRFRAQMDSRCEALDFYGGFYVESKDERICARREEVRTREGSTCRIEKFKALRAEVRR